MIKENMLDPTQLQKHLGHLKDKSYADQKRVEKQLENVEHQLDKFAEEKRNILNRYAKGKLGRDEYTPKCLWYDNEINKAKLIRTELLKQIPLLHKSNVMEMSIRRYCESIKARLEKCSDFSTKRQFFLDYIDKIIYQEGRVILHASVPIKLKAYEDPDQPSEASKIEFSIEGSK